MNAQQFKALFLPFHKRLYRTAFRLLGNAPDAEDMVQEVYLKLWSRRNELAEMENVEAYLVTLVKHMCYDALRASPPEEDGSPPDELPLAADDDVAQSVEMRDELGVVQTLIARLPADQRQIIVMRDVNGCSYEEIEEAAGLSQGNIRVLLCRARKKIREQFNAIRNYEYQ